GIGAEELAGKYKSNRSPSPEQLELIRAASVFGSRHHGKQARASLALRRRLLRRAIEKFGTILEGISGGGIFRPGIRARPPGYATSIGGPRLSRDDRVRLRPGHRSEWHSTTENLAAGAWQKLRRWLRPSAPWVTPGLSARMAG